MSNDAGEPAEETPAERPESGRRRLPIISRRPRTSADVDEGEARLAARLAHQFAQLRDERQAQLDMPAVVVGPAPPSRQVPWGVDLAASWAWRFLVIVAAGAVVFKAIGFLSVVVLPVVIALLITALVVPIVDLLVRIGLPRGLAALGVVIAGIALVGLLLTLAGQQIANGATDLADQTVAGLGEIKDWLKDGPLHASDSQINDYIQTDPGRDREAHQGGGEARAASPRSARRSATSSRASSSSSSRPTSSSPTVSGSGRGWSGCRPAPRAATSTARAGSPGSR